MLSVISTGTELRRFSRGRLPRLAVAAIVLIPLLYGALYLWAFWDPTGNLDKLPVALVNADTGATIDGQQQNAGDEVVARLTASKDLGWRVTDAADADQGVRDGTYNFAVTIPAGFSTDLASAAGADPTPARINVTYNDGTSFLATTLGRSAMVRIEQALSDTAGQQAVGKVLVGLGTARDGFAQASDGAVTLQAAAGTLGDGARQLADGATSAAHGAGSLAAGAHHLATGTQTLSAGTATLSAGAQQLTAGSATLATGASSLSTGSAALSAGTAQVSDGASRLAAGATDASRGAHDLATGTAQVSAGVGQAATQVTAMAGKLATLGSVAAYLKSLAFDPTTGAVIDPAAAAQLATLAAALPTPADSAALSSQLAQLQAGATHAAEGAATLDGGLATLAASSSALSAGATSAANGAATLATGAAHLTDGVSQVASAASALATGSGTLASGAASLDGGAATLATGADALATGTTTLASGSAQVADGAGRLADGAGSLSTALAGGASAIPNDDTAQQTARAATIATPVTLHDDDIAKAEGFGEGFAPFFIPLALFVGSLITWLLLRPLPSRALAAAVPGWRTAIAGFLPAVLLGLGQVAVMLAVVHFGVGLRMANPVGTVAFTVLVAAAFLALQQMLIALLGPSAGKGAVLALLMLQLASSGGTYPVATTPAFFRAVHPWLPMSYAVDGLRLLITGGADGRLVRTVVVLALTLVGSLAVTAWRAGRMRTWTLSRLHPALAI